MSDERLRKVIDELHQLLEQHEQLDDTDRDALRGALRDISGSLGESEDEEGGLDDVILRFRTEHPALAAGIQRLMDTLNNTGI